MRTRAPEWDGTLSQCETMHACAYARSTHTCVFMHTPWCAQMRFFLSHHITSGLPIRLQIKSLDELRFKFAYRPVDPNGWRMPWPFSRCYGHNAAFEYVGELDERGRPHGWGRWCDSQFHGESLKGYWERGLPVGPYKSVINGSGYGCRCFRIGAAVGVCGLVRGQVRPGWCDGCVWVVGV